MSSAGAVFFAVARGGEALLTLGPDVSEGSVVEGDAERGVELEQAPIEGVLGGAEGDAGADRACDLGLRRVGWHGEILVGVVEGALAGRGVVGVDAAAGEGAGVVGDAAAFFEQ